MVTSGSGKRSSHFLDQWVVVKIVIFRLVLHQLPIQFSGRTCQQKMERKTCWRVRPYNSCKRSTRNRKLSTVMPRPLPSNFRFYLSNLTFFGLGPCHDEFRSISGCSWWLVSRSFVLDCLRNGVFIRLGVLNRCILVLSMSCVTGSRVGVSWYLKKLSVGFGTVRGGEGSPFCSGLLDVGDWTSDTCAFRASIWALIPRCISLLCLKSSTNLCSRRLAALSCPPRASEIGKVYLIFLSEVLRVDSPRRRLLPFQYIGPNCFLRTRYLPVLADSVRAPTALFQVNPSLGVLAFRAWRFSPRVVARVTLPVLGWYNTFFLAPSFIWLGLP